MAIGAGPRADGAGSWRAWLTPVVAFALFGVLFHRYWAGAIVFRDSFTLYTPLKRLVALGLGEGRVYGWDPWQYMGMPFFADPLSSWLYPLNLFYLVLPLEPAHRLYILVHYPLALVFMWLFLRGRGHDPLVSFYGGAVFALSGYLASQHGNVPYLIGPALAPLALYCFERARRGCSAWAAGSGLAIAFQIFGGEPQSAAVTGALVGAWAGVEALSRPRRARPLALAALALMTAGLVSLVQTVPTLELLSHSARSGGVPLAEATLFSFHPARLLELIWPTPFGTIWPTDDYWGQFLLGEGVGVPWSLTVYVGAPALALLIAGAVLGPGWKRRLIVAGAAGFLLLAMGGFTPIHGAFHRLVPLADRFRFPEKYLAWFGLLAAIGAANGLAAISDRIERRPGAARRGGAAYLAVALAVALAVFALLRHALAGVAPPGPAAGWAAAQLGWGLGQTLAVNLGCGALLLASGRGGGWQRGARAAFVALTVADLYLANVRAMPAGDPALYAQKSAAGAAIAAKAAPTLGGYRVHRLGAFEFRPDAPAFDQLETALERRCRFWIETMEPNLATLDGFEYFAGLNAAAPKDGVELLEQAPSLSTLGRFNVGFVLAPLVAVERLGREAEVVFSDESTRVAVVAAPWAMPRAYWVPTAAVVSDSRTATRALASADPRAVVVLESAKYFSPGPAGSGEMRPAAVMAYRPDEVTLEVSADSAGWLVLSDRYYPGWRAWVDGVETKIYRANVLVRAVRLEAGRREVRFLYRPLSLRVGLDAALASLAALLAALFAHAVWPPRSSI